MSNFNRENYNRILRTNMFELDDRQNKECEEFFKTNNKETPINSPSFRKDRLELKKTHFKERLKVVIESLESSVESSFCIDENDEKIFFELLTNHSKGFIEQEKNGLRSFLFSIGLTPPNAIIDENIKAHENHLNIILSNAKDLLKISIDKHNKNVKPSEVKNSNGFLNKYGKDIIVGLLITVVGGIILYFVLSAI